MNNKGWLIYSEKDAIKNASFISWLKEEAQKTGLELELLFIERMAFGVTENQLSLYYDRQKKKLPPFAIVRTIHPLFTEQLEKMGVMLFNTSYVSKIANDKARAHQLLAESDIPMMDTLFIRPSSFQAEAIPFGFPLIAKLSGGRGGQQVHLVSNSKELDDALSTHPEQEWILQKVADVTGQDVRVFVVRNQIVGAVLRSSSGDFRANYSLGGEARYFELTTGQTALVHKVMQHFEIGMAGIDFLLDNRGRFIFNEIEDVVGSRTLSMTSDINIANLYMKYIADQVKEPGSD